MCNNSKDIECFVKQAKALDGLFPWCEECRKKYRKNKRSSKLEFYRSCDKQKRKDRVKWFHELKYNITCKDCNKIHEPICMDYDHISDKVKDVSRMVLDNTPKEKIILEIEKCELVCLLCHNKRTYNRFNDNLGKDRKYPSHVQRNIDIINNFKNKPCALCNNQYENYNMQIDHIDPSIKLFDICQMKSRKVEYLQNELDKCQVLCALCHRKKSISEQKDNKYKIDRIKPLKRKELFLDLEKELKECGKCHSIKEFKLFRKNKKTVSGIDTYCIECFNEYRRDRRKNN